MNGLSIATLLGTVTIGVLVAAGFVGFLQSVVFGAAGDLLAPMFGTLAMVVVVLTLLVLLGAGSKRWRANPYW